MSLNKHNNVAYDTQQIVDLLKCATEPYTIISLTLMFLEEEGLAKRIGMKICEISDNALEILIQKGVVAMVKGAYTAIKQPNNNVIMQSALDGYWGMVKESFNTLEGEFKEDDVIVSSFIPPHATLEHELRLTGESPTPEESQDDLI